MKPCKICHEPKSYHLKDYFWLTNSHSFALDNLAYLEKIHDRKELEKKRKALNFCQICKNIRKSPFGICQECCERLIRENQ